VFDRGRDKPAQLVDGSHTGTILVISGVPEPDGPDWRSQPVIEHEVVDKPASVAPGPLPSSPVVQRGRVDHVIEPPAPQPPKPKVYDWSREAVLTTLL
jgi:hypothetical protein